MSSTIMMPNLTSRKCDLGGSAAIYLRDISKSFNGCRVLDSISCELTEGKVILLRGANGAGKTTLIDILSGFRAPDAGSVEYRTPRAAGIFSFPEPWWRQGAFARFRPNTVARLGVTRTWQDMRLYPNHTLRENIDLAAPLQIGENPLWALTRPSLVRREQTRIMASSMKALEHMGLSSKGDSSGIGLSLGESKRAALARALATGAKIILLDEPLSGLDYEGVRSFIKTLETVSKEKEIVLLISEHVLNVPHVLPITTDVWTLAGGRIQTETADSARSAYPLAQSRAFLDLLQVGINMEQQNLPGGAKLSILSGSDLGPPVLEIKDAVVKRGSRLIPGTNGVSITIRAGQTGILEAPNGWGKSSLMLATAGTVPLISGSIHIMGQCVGALPIWKRARLGLGMLQSRDNSFPDLSVLEVLKLSGVNQSKVDPTLLNRQVTTLSGGERQKLSLVCFHDRKSPVALLDEPWTALDERGIEMAREIMIPRPGIGSLVSAPIGYEEQL